MIEVVMAGLVPAIHVLARGRDVDVRPVTIRTPAAGSIPLDQPF
jgi:hypothetical protein